MLKRASIESTVRLALYLVSREQQRAVDDVTWRMKCGDLKGAVALLPPKLGASTLARWRADGMINDEQLRAVLLRIWCLAEYPCHDLPRSTWLEWFAIAGFVTDNRDLPPKKPIQVWRVEYGRQLGLSWTRNPEVIERFVARGNFNGLAGRVLRTHIPPEKVLGFVEARNEQEVIVHPTVRIEAVERVVGVRPDVRF